MPTTIRRRAAMRALITTLSGSRGPGAPSVGQRLGAMPRMVSEGLSGRYPHLDKTRLLMAVLALLYIVSPIDVLPEALFAIFGLGDDAMVAAWLAGAVLSETDTYLAWQKAREHGADDIRIVPGEVISQGPAAR